MNSEIDILDILPHIRVPTLVMNRTGDPVAHDGTTDSLAHDETGARRSTPCASSSATRRGPSLGCCECASSS